MPPDENCQGGLTQRVRGARNLQFQRADEELRGGVEGEQAVPPHLLVHRVGHYGQLEALQELLLVYTA